MDALGKAHMGERATL